MKKEIKLNFRIVNPSGLTAFLKKLKTVDRSVILEIEGNEFFSKVRTPDKSVIKYVGSKVDSFFDGTQDIKRIKIGIMEMGRFMDVFKYFGPEEESFIEITSQLLSDEYVATGFRIYSTSIDIKFKCADISLLSYIEDKIQRNIHSADGADIAFPVSKESFAKLSSLTGIENNAEELLNFNVHSAGVSVKGNSFQYNLIKEPLEDYTDDINCSIYKNQFNFIDQEDSIFYIHENRIVVISEESDSIIAIGTIEI